MTNNSAKTSNAVSTGLDRLEVDYLSSLKGAKVGILANQASIDRKFRHIIDIVRDISSCQLVRLFAPEHGLYGGAQDMIAVEDCVDSTTKLPVVSLYGSSEDSLAPSEEQLVDLDVIIVDLPDIGSRYYTYAQSLGLVMEVAAKADTKVLVIDRPNPLSGAVVEGSPLFKSCRSFCGYAPVPQRHGLTLGELALMMKNGAGEGDQQIPAIDCELEIAKVNNWQRDLYFDQCQLPWVFPSPNMPTLETAIVYPGACLFEATMVSEGRGTTKPFELLGAPYIQPDVWKEAIAQEGLPLEGVELQAISFIPQFQKHEGLSCQGLCLHVTNRETFRPFRLALAMIAALAKSHADNFAWREQAYEFVKDVPAIDLLYGSDRFRSLVESGGKVAEIVSELDDFEMTFTESRKEFLLY